MRSADAARFDADYYRRYYFNQATAVTNARHAARMGDFVCAHLKYLRLPMRRVLDIGCGTGQWREIVARHFPRARFHGVEVSEYLCTRYGWERGSVVDYQASRPYDLVICQGVLAYLSRPDLARALANLGVLSAGALFLEAATREDYEQGVLDETLSDPHLYRHPAELYRRGLARPFRQLGGGLWLHRSAGVPLFALECAGE